VEDGGDVDGEGGRRWTCIGGGFSFSFDLVLLLGWQVGNGCWLRRGGGGIAGDMVLVLVPVAALLIAHVVVGDVVGFVVVVLSSAQLGGDGLGASPYRLRSPTRNGAGRRGMALCVLEADAGSCGRFGCTQCLDRLSPACGVVLAVWGVKMREMMGSLMAM
jgi:hypothetical protein